MGTSKAPPTMDRCCISSTEFPASIPSLPSTAKAYTLNSKQGSWAFITVSSWTAASRTEMRNGLRARRRTPASCFGVRLLSQATACHCIQKSNGFSGPLTTMPWTERTGIERRATSWQAGVPSATWNIVLLGSENPRWSVGRNGVSGPGKGRTRRYNAGNRGWWNGPNSTSGAPSI